MCTLCAQLMQPLVHTVIRNQIECPTNRVHGNSLNCSYTNFEFSGFFFRLSNGFQQSHSIVLLQLHRHQSVVQPHLTFNSY